MQNFPRGVVAFLIFIIGLLSVEGNVLAYMMPKLQYPHMSRVAYITVGFKTERQDKEMLFLLLQTEWVGVSSGVFVVWYAAGRGYPQCYNNIPNAGLFLC